jgi:hypothetical protein
MFAPFNFPSRPFAEKMRSVASRRQSKWPAFGLPAPVSEMQAGDDIE